MADAKATRIYETDTPGKKRELKAMISKLASVVSNLSSGLEDEGGENTVEFLIQELLSVISILTKFSRESDVHLEQMQFREQEAMSLLEKFKKIAKHQKEIIANLSQTARKDSITRDVETNTDEDPFPDSTQHHLSLQSQLEEASTKLKKVCFSLN